MDVLEHLFMKDLIPLNIMFLKIYLNIMAVPIKKMRGMIKDVPSILYLDDRISILQNLHSMKNKKETKLQIKLWIYFL